MCLCRLLQEQRLRYLKMHDKRQQQQASEQDKLQRLREIAENQEAKLKKVRALKGHVEQKRLSNGKLGEPHSVQQHIESLEWYVLTLIISILVVKQDDPFGLKNQLGNIQADGIIHLLQQHLNLIKLLKK